MSFSLPPDMETSAEVPEGRVPDRALSSGDLRALPTPPSTSPPFATRQADAGRTAPLAADGIALPAPLYLPVHAPDLHQDPRHNFVRGPLPAAHVPPPRQPTSSAWYFVQGPMYVAPGTDWEGQPILLWRSVADFRPEWHEPAFATRESAPPDHPPRTLDDYLPPLRDHRQPPALHDDARDYLHADSLPLRDHRLPPTFAASIPVYAPEPDAALPPNPPFGPGGRPAGVMQTVLEEHPPYWTIDPDLLAAEALNWDTALEGRSEIESIHNHQHLQPLPPTVVRHFDGDGAARPHQVDPDRSGEHPSAVGSSRPSPVARSTAQPPGFKELLARLNGDTAMASIRHWLAIQLSATDGEGDYVGLKPPPSPSEEQG